MTQMKDGGTDYRMHEKNMPPHRIVQATEQDREDLMALYALQKGRKFCFWPENYPSRENADEDLADHGLFIMKSSDGRLIAAVSIERDETVDALTCWDPQLQPSGEIARLAVHPDFQSQGLARRMVAHVMRVLKERGCRSMHLLVNVQNLPAIRSYQFFHFRQVGECDLYHQHFLCLEKDLANELFHPFPPLFDSQSRVLILGSFPSVKSRENMFYYGHRQNRFWPVVAAVFGERAPESIPQKSQLILSRHLALWDSIGGCEISGSADASIRGAIPNDLRIILDHAPIQRIYCNGKKSHEIYMRMIEPLTGRKAECLPSTSPANARWTMEQLIEVWKVIRRDALL